MLEILTPRQGPALMDTMTTHTTPANAQLVGDGPSYTLGVEDMPWADDLRTCCGDRWSFSTCSPVWNPDGTITPGVKVSSFDSHGDTHVDQWERHPTLDGQIFPTHEDAKRAAYEAGVLRHFVYVSGR